MLVGDRVKLVDKVARAASYHNRKRHGVDWTKRRGEVMSVTRLCVTILWDGRTSWDTWPPHAVEKVEE